MERTLSATRIFSLGNYQNLQITNTLSDVPEPLSLDQDFVRSMVKLQLVEIEFEFNNYCMLREKTKQGKSFEEVAVILEETRIEEVEELFKNSKFNEYIEKLMKPIEETK